MKSKLVLGLAVILLLEFIGIGAILYIIESRPKIIEVPVPIVTTEVQVVEVPVVEEQPEKAPTCLYGAFSSDGEMFLIPYRTVGAAEEGMKELFLCGQGLEYKGEPPEDSTLSNPQAWDGDFN